MCRSVAWDRGESRVSPVLVVTRHPLLGGTLEIPLADLTRPLRIISVTPRQEKRRVWSIALGSTRRKLTLRASSTAQYAKWTRLTREWLQLGHDMSASVVTASPTATATSETTNAHRRRKRSSRRHAAAQWTFEPKAVVDSPVPWNLEMLPSPLSSPSSSSSSARSESTTYFTATTDPPALSSRIRLDSDDNESNGGGDQEEEEEQQSTETDGTSLSVFSLLQVLQAQEASLETISSARTSTDAQSDNMSIGPLSEATTDGGMASLRDTGVSFSVDENGGSMSATAVEWTHPTGRALSSASLSSWLSESDQADQEHDQDDAGHGRSQRAQTVAMLELPNRRESEDGSEGGRESFDYEATFPWIFTDAPDRRVVVITGPRPTDGGDAQTVYFF